VSDAAPAGGAKRAVPYLCPFCGEEDLRPTDHEGQPVWHCRACLRLFSLTFHGVASATASAVPATRPSDWSDD
jgi:ribosomal protein L37AE/L43A